MGLEDSTHPTTHFDRAALARSMKAMSAASYLYYNADHRHWIDPLSVTITAK